MRKSELHALRNTTTYVIKRSYSLDLTLDHLTKPYSSSCRPSDYYDKSIRKLAILGLVDYDKAEGVVYLTQLGYEAQRKLRAVNESKVRVQVKINHEILDRAIRGLRGYKSIFSDELTEAARTRRHFRLTLETREARTRFNGLLHDVLRKLRAGVNRFNSLRQNVYHAYDMQTALVYGLMDQTTIDGKTRYCMTEVGKRALEVIETTDRREYCKRCKKRVDCLSVEDFLKECKFGVTIPIQPSEKWIEHFETRVW